MTIPKVATSSWAWRRKVSGRIVGNLGNNTIQSDGDDVIEEPDGPASVAAQYTQGLGIDQPLALSGTGGTYFYHTDGLGSVTSLTGGSGQIAASYEYDSFGKLTASTGSVTNPFQYTGREYDPETGLYYYRARYYDPKTGRFIGEDPMAFGGGSNFYAYVANRPVVVTDPFGLQGGWLEQLKKWLFGPPKPPPPKPKVWRFNLCDAGQKPLFYDSSPWNPYTNYEKWLDWKSHFIDRCSAAKTPGKETVTFCSTEPISYGGTAGFCYCCEYCEKASK
jgi:RHS repeat-associated protein